MNSDKLMVVAHPDDESLFGGAQILSSKGWKVVCVTNGYNHTRRLEFETVMSMTECEYEMWNYSDRWQEIIDDSVFNDLQRVVSEKPWSKIVTHNVVGEYGHLHHIQIHHMMKKLVPNLWTFAFYGESLDKEIWDKKVSLVEVYKSQKSICDGHLPNVTNEKITTSTIKYI